MNREMTQEERKKYFKIYDRITVFFLSPVPNTKFYSHELLKSLTDAQETIRNALIKNLTNKHLSNVVGIVDDLL